MLVEGEINDKRVRYRSGPSTNAEILGMFNKKDKVQVIHNYISYPIVLGEYWKNVNNAILIH
ncbi:MAG: SH3 domain-containing protein [Treponemataceae bacterium]|nr:SH3 domain-containing protein [Treponemataceae bacterium]